MNQVKILTHQATYLSLQQWQQDYGLPGGTDKIGHYFSLSERRFQEDLQLFGTLVVCAPLMRLLDRFRTLVGRPVHINSFNRTEEYQQELRRRGHRVATSSPHVAKMAADIDTISVGQTYTWAEQMKRASDLCGVPARIGYRDYAARGQTFIHVDVCPLYFAPDAPLHHIPHPVAWERAGATW